jgi:hypothetical protein
LPPPHHYFTRLHTALAGGTVSPAGQGERFVSDIFREVDEEVRRERLTKLWERYGGLLIGACVLLVVAVGGWRGYEWYESKKAAEAGASFEAAIALSDQGKHKEAEEAFAKLSADGPSSYRMLAKFREAAELSQRDPKFAVALYDQLAGDARIGQALQDLAAARAALILLDTAPYAEIRQRLEPLTAPGRTFRHSARSTLALSAWRAKDTTAMQRWTDMILADAETPAGTRGQIQMLLALSEADKKS